MVFAEKSSVVHSICRFGDTNHVKVLTVGGALDSTLRHLHAPSAVGVPRLHLTVEVIPAENASPTCGIHAVANIGGESRGRDIRHSAAGTKDGGPDKGVQIFSKTGEELPAVGDIVLCVVYQRAARSLGLSEDKNVVLFARADEIRLVVGRRAEEGGQRGPAHQEKNPKSCMYILLPHHF